MGSRFSVADSDWQGTILFAYGTGARLGDVANVHWLSLDVASGIGVFTEQKTSSRAVIGLHPDFLDWLSSSPAPSAWTLRCSALSPVSPLMGSMGSRTPSSSYWTEQGSKSASSRRGTPGRDEISTSHSLGRKVEREFIRLPVVDLLVRRKPSVVIPWEMSAREVTCHSDRLHKGFWLEILLIVHGKRCVYRGSVK